jgi:hypothetical protein
MISLLNTVASCTEVPKVGLARRGGEARTSVAAVMGSFISADSEKTRAQCLDSFPALPLHFFPSAFLSLLLFVFLIAPLVAQLARTSCLP